MFYKNTSCGTSQERTRGPPQAIRAVSVRANGCESQRNKGMNKIPPTHPWDKWASEAVVRAGFYRSGWGRNHDESRMPTGLSLAKVGLPPCGGRLRLPLLLGLLRGGEVTSPTATSWSGVSEGQEVFTGSLGSGLLLAEFSEPTEWFTNDFSRI